MGILQNDDHWSQATRSLTALQSFIVPTQDLNMSFKNFGSQVHNTNILQQFEQVTYTRIRVCILYQPILPCLEESAFTHVEVQMFRSEISWTICERIVCDFDLQ